MYDRSPDIGRDSSLGRRRCLVEISTQKVGERLLRRMFGLFRLFKPFCSELVYKKDKMKHVESRLVLEPAFAMF